jgi:hypothetical protein
MFFLGGDVEKMQNNFFRLAIKDRFPVACDFGDTSTCPTMI